MPSSFSNYAEFSVNAWVVASPKGAKRIIGIFCGQAVFAPWTPQPRAAGGTLTHQIHVAVGAARKPRPILRFALWTIHGMPALGLFRAPMVTLFSTFSRGISIEGLKDFNQPEIALDFPLIYDILTFVGYCVWSGGSLLPLFFFGSPFSGCTKPKTTRIAPFRINHLQIAIS